MKSTVVLSNLIWRYAERFGAQLVSFLVTTILARILTPEDYGSVAIIAVLTTILQVFVDSGLGNALIQKKDADDIDFSTVFYTNIVFCIFLYMLLFIFAPTFATFFNDIKLVPYIRVLGLTVIISGIKNVQQAYISKNMLFKKFFYSTLAGTILAGIVGIIMAINGLGIWALVTQQILNLSVDTLVLWITVKWRPRLYFSLERLKGLYSFGWKLLASSLLNTVYNNLRQVVIGKKYTNSDLAYYNNGDKYPNLIILNLYMSINSVLLPVMSSCQDDLKQVKNITRKSIKLSTFIVAPLLIGFAFLATPFVRLILTDKWLPSVFFIQLFCLYYIFYPIDSTNLSALKALGRSDIFLKLEIIKKVFNIAILVTTMFISVEAMAISLPITAIIEIFIDGYPNRKIINYSYKEQIKDILPPLLLSGLMGIVILPIQYLGLNDLIVILLSIPLGALVYIFLSTIFKIDSFYYVLNMVKPYLNKLINKAKK